MYKQNGASKEVHSHVPAPGQALFWPNRVFSLPPSTGAQGGDCTNPLVPAPSSGFLQQEWTQICLLQVDRGQHHWVLLGIREGVLFDLKKSQVGSTTAPIKLLFQ